MVADGDVAGSARAGTASAGVRIDPLLGLPAIEPGDDLAALLVQAIEVAGGLSLGKRYGLY